MTTVEIHAQDQLGAAAANARVLFELDAPDVVDADATLVIPARISADLDLHGIAQIELHPNTSGRRGTQYRVYFFRPQTAIAFWQTRITVPDTGVAKFGDLITDPPPGKSAAQAAQDAAIQAAADAAASEAATLNFGAALTVDGEAVDSGEAFSVDYDAGAPSIFFQIPRGEQGIQGPTGATGPAGADGADGTDGNNGWSPILATVTDGARRVHQVTDWTGGAGTKPATGQYIGISGLVADIADGVDIRGAEGAAGSTSVPAWLAAQNYGQDRILAYDTFNRADAAAATDALGVSDSGHTWTGEDISTAAWLTDGRWSYPELAGKQAQGGDSLNAQFSVATIALADAAFVDSNNLRVLRFVVDVTGASPAGVIMRWADIDNHLICWLGGNNGRRLEIVERVSGVSTLVAFSDDNTVLGVTRAGRLTVDVSIYSGGLFVAAQGNGGGWLKASYSRAAADNQTFYDAIVAATECGIIFADSQPAISSFSLMDLPRAL